GQLRVEDQTDRDDVAAGIGLDQVARLADDTIHVGRLAVAVALAHEVTHPADDLSGPQALRGDVGHGLLQVGGLEPAFAQAHADSVRVVDDGAPRVGV